MRWKPCIFEHRSAAYVLICEQRSAENPWFTSIIVDYEDSFKARNCLHMIIYALIQRLKNLSSHSTVLAINALFSVIRCSHITTKIERFCLSLANVKTGSKCLLICLIISVSSLVAQAETIPLD